MPVHVENLADAMRILEFLAAGLRKAAKRRHAEIGIGPGGGAHTPRCAIIAVFGMDEPEKQFRFRMSFSRFSFSKSGSSCVGTVGM